MNRARAALCGLTLALGAAGAVADDDDWLALFSSCVVSTSDLSMALWTEFPDFIGAPPTGEERSFEEEAALLKREVEADPAGFLETVAEGRPRSVVVSEWCAVAALLANFLGWAEQANEAEKRGDEAALVELEQRFDKLILESGLDPLFFLDR